MNDASTARFRFHWACMLVNAGRYEEGLEIYLDIARVREEAFGENALRTLHVYYCVAETSY